jgi:hypothetical protein
MGNIWMHPSRTLLRMSVLSLYALAMRGQTADTGAMAGALTHERFLSSADCPSARSTWSD